MDRDVINIFPQYHYTYYTITKLFSSMQLRPAPASGESESWLQMSNRRHCDDRPLEVRNKIDLQTTVESSRLKNSANTYVRCQHAFRRAKRPGNRIGGEINVRAPQIDAHVGAIESKFGSFGVDSSVGLRTGPALTWTVGISILVISEHKYKQVLCTVKDLNEWG